jgi:hypothetical protein
MASSLYAQNPTPKTIIATSLSMRGSCAAGFEYFYPFPADDAEGNGGIYQGFSDLNLREIWAGRIFYASVDS